MKKKKKKFNFHCKIISVIRRVINNNRYLRHSFLPIISIVLILTRIIIIIIAKYISVMYI